MFLGLLGNFHRLVFG